MDNPGRGSSDSLKFNHIPIIGRDGLHLCATNFTPSDSLKFLALPQLMDKTSLATHALLTMLVQRLK